MRRKTHHRRQTTGNTRAVDSTRVLSVSLCLFLITLLLISTAGAQTVPPVDSRAAVTRHLDMTYTFPAYRTKEEWLKRAKHLRRQVLTSAGLWPMPPRTPLRPVVFGRLDRGDYTIEKVYFESYPGFYVTGNLYRPKNPQGRIPAVLNPHGHWVYGRLENTQVASIPARAANFARLGMVAFTYDMVGYDDSSAISHRFAIGHREGFDQAALWSVNLLGLQLWNSIRSLDFLLTLPEVDPDRIGCTGESGGGTQTFLLTAVDDRIKVAAPVNMISSVMQGGSLCENAPNLRIDTNNMEIGAMAAPRPMLMVSATGDWTKNTLTVEYPAVRSIYQLFGAEDSLRAIQIDAPHNYNQQSREAVYGWFAHYLLGRPEKTPLREKSTNIAFPPELLVFYGRPRPEHELDENALLESRIQFGQKQLNEAQPKDVASLERFRLEFGVPFEYSLMAEYPRPEEVIETGSSAREAQAHTVVLSRRDRGDRVEMARWMPVPTKAPRATILLITASGDVEGGAAVPRTLIDRLVAGGNAVVAVRCFSSRMRPKNEYKFFTTYNRTDDANRVQDILTAIAYLHQRNANAPIKIVAAGRAGLWALLARGLAPRVDRMVVDVDGFDNSNDEAFINQLPIPGIRRAGDFVTAAAIAPLTPLLIHNTKTRFRTDRIADVFRLFGKAADFEVRSDAMTTDELFAWLMRD